MFVSHFENKIVLPAAPTMLHQKSTFNLVNKLRYTITINHQLLIYTSMTHSLLSLKLLELALNSLDTLSDVTIKALTLLFLFRHCLLKTQA